MKRIVDYVCALEPGAVPPEKFPTPSGKGVRTIFSHDSSEAAAWLSFLIKNYAKLAETTVFLCADPLRYLSEIPMPQEIWDDERPMAYLGVRPDADKPWPFPMASMHLNLHTKVWGDAPPAAGMFRVGGQFFARSCLIRQHARQHYEAYYSLRETPHFNHLLEGSWHTVFATYETTCKEAKNEV